MRRLAVLGILVLAGCSSVLISKRDQYQIGRTLASKSDRRICSDYQNIQFISIENSITGSCESFNFLDKAIADFNPLRISKKKLSLGSITVNNFSGWNWGEEGLGTIHFFVKDNNAAWNEANMYIFAHEVGHLILEGYLAERHPLSAKLLELQQINFEYLKYVLPILELRKSDPVCNDPESACGKRVSELIARSPVDLKGPSPEQRMRSFESENKAELDRFIEVMGHYHELFADLFQSLYFDNPESNNITNLGVGLPLETCRTFTAELASDFKSDNPHCSLSSIRKEIWQKYVIPSLPEKKRILRMAADAIWADAHPYLMSQNTEFDPTVAAKSLLNRMLLMSKKP